MTIETLQERINQFATVDALVVSPKNRPAFFGLLTQGISKKTTRRNEELSSLGFRKKVGNLNATHFAPTAAWPREAPAFETFGTAGRQP